MTKTKNKMKYKEGFTLVELLIVIAIIGILTSIVLVSTQGALDKSKFTSALTSASSVLPEIATCYDDGGDISVPNNATTPTNVICVSPTITPVDTVAEPGHTVNWPALSSSGGWTYKSPTSITGNGSISGMTFTLYNANSAYGSTQHYVTCVYSSSTCS